jgi:hypothetical protein
MRKYKNINNIICLGKYYQALVWVYANLVVAAKAGTQKVISPEAAYFGCFAK